MHKGFNKTLDTLGFQLFDAQKALQHVIQSYWFVSNPSLKAEKIETTIASDGGCGIVFNFAGEITNQYKKSIFTKKAKVYIDGPSKFANHMSFTTPIDAVGVRFLPGRGFGFFQKAMKDYTDKVITLTKENDSFNLLGLHEELLKTKDGVKRLALLNAFFSQHLLGLSPEQKVQEALIMLNKEEVCIEEVAKNLLISPRHLSRLFSTYLGLSAKDYLRLLRIRKSTKFMKEKACSLTAIGYESGFFDQSHFIKEFKHIVQDSPKNFLKQQQEVYAHQGPIFVAKNSKTLEKK